MSKSHYEKYKQTIKEVTKRNYRKRVSSLNQYLVNGKCLHCSESEIACLKFYPHDKKKERKTIKKENRKNEKMKERMKDIKKKEKRE